MFILDFSTIINIIVFKKYRKPKNVKNILTERDCDKYKASAPYYDKYMLFKLLITHILGIFYNYCSL